MLVSPEEVARLNIISPLKSRDMQIQSSGIDLTLNAAYSFLSAGTIDFDNTCRQTPKLKSLEFIDNFIDLAPGAYILEFVEKITVPLNMTAFLHARSSINRSGVLFDTGLYDAGYSGTIGATIQVSNPFGIRLKKYARICQCVCFLMNDASTKGYSGIYQQKD